MSVNWLPWSEAAFARAEREDKPILLSISAVWCHWCHVMDRTTYGDAGVARAIEERFVPIRVDNDERPDINARYNMGGWPTTAFLAPDGTILTGATYLPAAQMRRALDEIAEFYATKRGEIAQRANELRDARRPFEPVDPGDLTLEPVARVRAALEEQYDDEFGGFGDAPKFPQPEALEFLLWEWRVTGDARLYDIVARTMREMSRGGMYDHVEGGFFRYSTTRDWSVPHFEKMAEDHAGLIRVLAQLLLWARAADLRPALLSSLRYVRECLRDANSGLFYGSQDADEEYYSRPLDERRAMKAPFIDRRSYADWSAELAGAWCWAAQALDDDTLLGEAAAALEALHERFGDDDGLLFHVQPPDGPAAVAGLFADQAAYIRALLDAYEVTGATRLLERAQAHAGRTVVAFEAPEGGFYDRRPDEGLGRLVLQDRPIVDNGLFADTLLRLAALTGDESYRQAAGRALALYSATFTGAGAFAAPYARALRRYLAPPTVLHVGGDMPDASSMREAARRLPDPLLSIATDPGRAEANLCIGTLCGEPFAGASDLRARFDAIAG